jgi:uncharacterized membrane protein YuzA (DUF378 family)
MSNTTSASNTRFTPANSPSTATLNPIDWLALVLMIVGSVNWGLVGAANFDLVAALFGSGSAISRIVYVLVGLAGLYGLAMAFKLGSRQKAG